MGSASVSRIFFRFSSLIVTTSAFVKKKSSKMRHLKKFVKPMEVKLRCPIDLRFPAGMLIIHLQKRDSIYNRCLSYLSCILSTFSSELRLKIILVLPFVGIFHVKSIKIMFLNLDANLLKYVRP